jgi:Peptidase propeptide and YPEB domain
MIYAFLKSIFAGAGRPANRLSEAEALEIARKALPGDMPLFVKDVKRRSDGLADGLEWVIGTATIGSGQAVHIDDATGAVLEVVPWGVR